VASFRSARSVSGFILLFARWAFARLLGGFCVRTQWVAPFSVVHSVSGFFLCLPDGLLLTSWVALLCALDEWLLFPTRSLIEWLSFFLSPMGFSSPPGWLPCVFAPVVHCLMLGLGSSGLCGYYEMQMRSGCSPFRFLHCRWFILRVVLLGAVVLLRWLCLRSQYRQGLFSFVFVVLELLTDCI